MAGSGGGAYLKASKALSSFIYKSFSFYHSPSYSMWVLRKSSVVLSARGSGTNKDTVFFPRGGMKPIRIAYTLQTTIGHQFTCCTVIGKKNHQMNKNSQKHIKKCIKKYIKCHLKHIY